MRLKSMNPDQLWTDYVITNQVSGKSYRLALRGWQPGESYCSCPDFRKNTLGTCKHIIYALMRGRAKFSKKVQNTPAPVDAVAVYLKYGRNLELRLLLPKNSTTSSWDTGKLSRPFSIKNFCPKWTCSGCKRPC